MKQTNIERYENKINFQTEKLQVDWIGLNYQYCDDCEGIGNFLFNSWNFNVFLKIGQSGEPIPIFFDSANLYSCVLIQIQNFYWTGIKINFSGKNGAYFYDLVKKQLFNWNIFDLNFISLSRLDVQYLRAEKETDLPLDKFFQETIQNLKRQKRKVSYNLDTKVLRLGKRSSARFYRVYEKKEEKKVNFEFEIKGRVAKSFQESLFLNQVEDFEEKVTDEFYKYSQRLLPLRESHTDWVMIYLRKQRKNSKGLALVTTYLESTLSQNQDERETLFKLFQFLSFVRSLSDEQIVKKVLSNQVYYEITFQLKDFVQFLGLKLNYYQIKKIKEFFNLLYNFQNQQGVRNQISETCFRSYVVFPSLSLEKRGKSNLWTISISMAEELYLYLYPYFFPVEFLRFENKYDREIKTELWHVMSSVDCKKQLELGNFLSRFCVSNSKKRAIKKRILELLTLLTVQKYIQPYFQLVDEFGKTSESTELSLPLLRKINAICFFEHY